MCLLEHNGNGDAVLVSVAASRRDGEHRTPRLCHRSVLNHLPKNCFSYAVAS